MGSEGDFNRRCLEEWRDYGMADEEETYVLFTVAARDPVESLLHLGFCSTVYRTEEWCVGRQKMVSSLWFLGTTRRRVSISTEWSTEGMSSAFESRWCSISQRRRWLFNGSGG
ncbi:hypothetical protein YC2023_104793 [Brassica napus]